MNWKTVALGEIIELQNGFAFKSSEYAEEGYFLMRITNVQQGFIQNNNPKYVSIPQDSKLKQFILNEGDILMSLTGDVGRVGVLQEHNLPAALNQRVARIIIKSIREVDKNYLFNLLNSELVRTKIEALGHGAAQLNVSTKDILSLEIPLPPLATQQKIVSKLDAIFAEIDKATAAAEGNAKNAEALFQSYLTGVFERGGEGWTNRKLGEITTKIGSGATPKGGNQSYKETGISLIRSMNVYDDGFFYPNLAFIDDTQARDLSNVTVEENDVLLNITGASVARCCVVPSDILPARVNQHVSILRAIKNVINPLLLHFLLISPLHKRRLLNVGEGGGTTRQAITKAQLQEYPISFPISQVEQLDLIQKISEIHSFSEKIKMSQYKKQKTLQVLKQAIIKNAVNGELVKA